MQIVNFSHPLTAQQLTQIEAQLGSKIDSVRNVRVQFQVEQPFVPQVTALLDSLGITAEQWRTEAWLIVPPAMSAIAVILLAQLHSRMGRFPTIVRLRSVANALVSTFELAEIVNLAAPAQPPAPAPAPTPASAPAPAPARERRVQKYASANGRFGVVLYAEWELTKLGFSQKWVIRQPVRGRVEVKRQDGFAHVNVVEDSDAATFVVITHAKGGVGNARTPDGQIIPPVAYLNGDNAIQVFVLPQGAVVKTYGYKRRSSQTRRVGPDGALVEVNPFE